MHPLDSLLETYRTQTVAERDKGTAFEKLIAVWLVTDPVRAQRFDRVESWSDWARRADRDRSDVGIDLVGTLKDGTLAAVQCKFFDAQRSIRKEDIDSFISASAKHAFSERIIVETTEKPWSPNAEDMLQDQTIPTNRVGIRDLRESGVDWSAFEATGRIGRRRPKQLRPDQQQAFEAVTQGLGKADRGKLIMACGTGKTLAGLRIAEEIAGAGGSVLVLVPSLALMSQTIREWHDNALVKEIKAFAVCSDTKVGKRRRSRVDVAELEVTDLELPATTDAAKLSAAFLKAGGNSLRVVFATYQSISVISDAQAKHDLPGFDFIMCDEAHRTTGVTLAGEDESSFVKVHDDTTIRGAKRLYMTATPRIYSDNAQSKARDVDATLASMDDKKLYGEHLYHYGFAQAVENGILSDYRVIVLVMDEGQVSAALQQRLADEDSGELKLDDVTKIVGCYKALAKDGLSKDSTRRSLPMRRAIAFCKSIKASEMVCEEFTEVVEQYIANSSDEEHAPRILQCDARHVDGTYNARERGDLLDWLRDNAGRNECRILSNARCLTEGVDVPALDAILFLHPRKSQIDVVQAVGRVMRRAEGKEMGYVVLPVGIPPNVPADQALNNNENYRVVWQILNALRAHDERLDAVINQGGLGQDVSDRISIVDGRSFENSTELRSVTAVVDDLPTRSRERSRIGEGRGDYGGDAPPDPSPHQLVIDEFSRAIMAKIVEKCGSRVYWEDWAKDVSDIAQAHITRIGALVSQDGTDAQAFFQDFLEELRDDLNESVSEDEALEMLAQHLITRPVFDALFEDHTFVEQNPISKAMTDVLSVIDEAGVSREAENLEDFYASVRRRASGITDPQARQKLIVELYDKFFRGAFPLTTQKLGIVYTPVEIVDFIIHSVDEVLREEFGQTLGSKGVHIIDPFVGTGTFITRLLQSGLIAPDDLERKYREEIHANEIVLLAYYIAAINIETVFHAVAEREAYLPFEGICLTDTFALHEGDDELSFYMKENTDRRERQKATEIQVIVGNPPYSAGQKKQDDNAKNVSYARLDQRIRSTYAQHSQANLLRNLYDSYIRAIRWGSDRIGETGVMAYVTNAGWLEANAMDGMRKCIAEEFASVHVFHLRGNQRTQGEESRREGGKIFGSGSRAPIAISVFVKNPAAPEQGRILFHDIGDYLDRKQKLDFIKGLRSIGGINENGEWKRITPDKHGDWLDQRQEGYVAFLKVGDKKDKRREVLFNNHSPGVVTSRDAWCINPSRALLREKIESTIHFFNSEVQRWKAAEDKARQQGSELLKVDDFLESSTKRISWSRSLKQDVRKGKTLDQSEGEIVLCLYRPFTKQWQFYSRRLNEVVSQMPQVFPNGELPNRVISVTGKGGRSGFSCLMLNALPNFHTIDSSQCFPFWLYEKCESGKGSLLADGEDTGYQRREAITDYGLDHFRAAYPGENITKEDIFHYVYGLLHSEDYRERYRANLAKELPRIPCVTSAKDYRAFRDAGKSLGELHVGYESADPYDAEIDTVGKSLDDMDPEVAHRVIGMKHPKSGRTKDRTTVVYNAHITIRNIPEAAWDYVVNGKPALQWVIERQCVTTHKDSGIVSDANRYAIETVGDPRYPLDLFLRVITVSLETTRIVNPLPKLQVSS